MVHLFILISPPGGLEHSVLFLSSCCEHHLFSVTCHHIVMFIIFLHVFNTHTHTQSADCKHTQHMTCSPPSPPPPPPDSSVLFSWGSALNKSQTVRRVSRRVIGDTVFSACRSSWLFFVCCKTKASEGAEEAPSSSLLTSGRSADKWTYLSMRTFSRQHSFS